MGSTSHSVAMAGCRRARGSEETDLYPDLDWPVLRAALVEAGNHVSSVAWDARDIDWASFDVAVVRSTWDSVDRPQEYLAWARRTARVTDLRNPLPAIEWNLEKTYLRRLEARDIPVVPTRWLQTVTDWTPPPHQFVVKPSISGGGRETARYQAREAPLAVAHVRRLLDAGLTVMVQPYLPSVEDEGEVKIVFIGGRFSHAVRVGPLLEAGAGVMERPWEKPVPVTATAPSPAQLRAARAVLDAVDAEIETPLLYARVDLVAAGDGHPLLAEVELVDPSLFLRLAPGAARSLAEAIGSGAQR